MVTIKNLRTARWTLLLAACVVAGLASGCKPAGASALLKGKKLLDQGKPAEAIPALQKAANALVTNAIAWNCLAVAQHLTGKTADAASSYQNALANNPNLFEAHQGYGSLLLEQGNPAAARNEFAACINLRQQDAGSWSKLGLAQLRTRDFANAERSYATALNFNTQMPDAWNGLGLVQSQRNRPRDAATSFGNALKLQPDHAAALLNLAVLYQTSLNNHPAALEKYRAYAALKNAPNQDDVAAVIKQLDNELNPPALAVRTNTPTIASAGNTNSRPAISSPKLMVVVSNPPPRVSKPNPTLIRTNVPTETVRLTNEAPLKVAVDSSGSANPSTGTAVTETNAPAPKPVVIARYHYHNAGKPKAGNRALAGPAFDRGMQAQDDHRLTEALGAFRDATVADPSYFNAYYNLAWVAYTLKDWPTALQAYETALTLDPASTDARYNFALALKQAGYPLDAANELEKLLARKSDDAAAHFMLANLYAQQLGGTELARPHYQKVLELKPQHPMATQIRYWLTENP